MLTIPHYGVGVFSASFLARRSQLYRPTCEHLDAGQKTGLNALVSPRLESSRCETISSERPLPERLRP